MPATVGSLLGQPVLERQWNKFHVEVFNSAGYLIGIRQYDFDFGEYPETFQGEPELEFRQALNFEKYRLSWLARRRSPEVPAAFAQEFINGLNEALRNTCRNDPRLHFAADSSRNPPLFCAKKKYVLL
jgi:hypothetical protein